MLCADTGVTGVWFTVSVTVLRFEVVPFKCLGVLPDALRLFCPFVRFARAGEALVGLLVDFLLRS